MQIMPEDIAEYTVLTEATNILKNHYDPDGKQHVPEFVLQTIHLLTKQVSKLQYRWIPALERKQDDQ